MILKENVTALENQRHKLHSEHARLFSELAQHKGRRAKYGNIFKNDKVGATKDVIFYMRA